MSDLLIESEIDLEDAHAHAFLTHARGSRIQITYNAWCAVLCSYIAYLVESLIIAGIWAAIAALYVGLAIFLIPTYREAKRLARAALQRKQRLEANLQAIEALGDKLRRYGEQRWLQ